MCGFLVVLVGVCFLGFVQGTSSMSEDVQKPLDLTDVTDATGGWS